MTLLWVALGAAVGAPLRYAVGHFLDRQVPWGTVLVNVVGSFLLGLLSGMALTGAAMALVGVGFCGGLTTYSAFAVQTVDRGPRIGLVNVLLTVPPALLACALGFVLAPS
ncbi:MAG: Fluoride ion transporter CrcB [uncultured Nocardioidaceae bacterium]|uniref:Fluoride-specific ion channel FluC n=1 Tax=uncultured Nocardioidaceae bacterium TaxID=253824 RepID=A0A6J4MVZ4_9ACTN|nr:MAG: Fluoride ion transporter CrcB [uncultured Nocardioidaceae bacterium]